MYAVGQPVISSTIGTDCSLWYWIFGPAGGGTLRIESVPGQDLPDLRAGDAAAGQFRLQVDDDAPQLVRVEAGHFLLGDTDEPFTDARLGAFHGSLTTFLGSLPADAVTRARNLVGSTETDSGDGAGCVAESALMGGIGGAIAGGIAGLVVGGPGGAAEGAKTGFLVGAVLGAGVGVLTC
ncbi:hypothetical protein ACFFSW_06840 [Saccharothrix longispora]|uniref:Uncharacterized protein n=1 Tax=Saccharothrix longispora TaxID=33920 RepID=A0ABU1PT16_9PSEU|nr:hypothetical protein [Saccharothrix longispora]MDR6593785.1 hypothetical protein [Saccharothrix longispora]